MQGGSKRAYRSFRMPHQASAASFQADKRSMAGCSRVLKAWRKCIRATIGGSALQSNMWVRLEVEGLQAQDACCKAQVCGR